MFSTLRYIGKGAVLHVRYIDAVTAPRTEIKIIRNMLISVVIAINKKCLEVIVWNYSPHRLFIVSKNLLLHLNNEK